MSKTLPIKKEFPYDRIGSFTNMNPFVIDFIYPQMGLPFIIKGGLKQVNKWYNGFGPAAIIKRTLWCHGIHRGYWMGHKVFFYTRKPTQLKGHRKGRPCSFGWTIMTQDKDGKSVELKTVRRMPRKWMKELNDYV